jgi:hypothetical protein
MPHITARISRAALIWAVAVLALLVPAAGYALDGTASVVSASVQPRGQAFELTGKIVSVDYAQNVIVVRSHGQDFTVAITPTTAVEHAGQAGGISDLRAGVRIHVTGATQNGVMTADDIVIKGKD